MCILLLSYGLFFLHLQEWYSIVNFLTLKILQISLNVHKLFYAIQIPLLLSQDGMYIIPHVNSKKYNVQWT